MSDVSGELMTAPFGRRSAGRSDARTLATILLSPAISVSPLALIASRWAPRATTETSLPASARRAAKLPPIAPAPNTQIRMNRSLLPASAASNEVEPRSGSTSLETRWLEAPRSEAQSIRLITAEWIVLYRRAKPGRENMALGEYRGLAYRNNVDLAAWLAKPPPEQSLEPELPVIDPHHHLW